MENLELTTTITKINRFNFKTQWMAQQQYGGDREKNQ